MTLTFGFFLTQLVAVTLLLWVFWVGACPMTEVASMTWGRSKPRDMCLSIRKSLRITVCTCELLSYPNSLATSGLVEPHTDFASWLGLETGLLGEF